MRIELDNVVPAPLREREELDSDIWAVQTEFEHPGCYQIWAPSGRGKTTFTHILYGLRRDYTGSLRINEKPARDFRSDDWAELRQSHFSIVFQDLRLFPYLTAWENICIKQVLQPYLSEAELRQLCRDLSIEGLLDKRCDQVSFGEQQRIAIVRAMAQPFEWLLLDEPFSHLDSSNIEIVSQLITQQCQLRRAGCILLTLDPIQHFENTCSLRL